MKKKILIYQDQGAFREGVRHTSSTFQELLGFNYEIQLVSARDLLQRTWEKSTALLIFPGGADIPYMKLLKGRGNQRIRSYVENGGAFIGLCAGAYYSGDIVEFALNTSLEVREERELKFFPGIVRGPLLAPYEYETPSGVRAAKIYCNDLPISLYYNGGGYFKEAEQKKDVLVLGTYDQQKEFPAIIECNVGKGKAILSGVHFEYNPNLLDKTNPFLNPVIPKLQRDNDQRIRLLTHLFNRLNLRNGI